jgi:hypothetical protein
MSLTRKRKSSPKVEANRQNGRKSNGPCTPQGKLHVALNALKHGLHAEPVIQGMLAIGQKPRNQQCSVAHSSRAPNEARQDRHSPGARRVAGESRGIELVWRKLL